MCKDEEAINNIMAAISCMINPFTSTEDQLINISSGIVDEKDAWKDIASAEEIGKHAFKQYYETQQENALNIFAAIKQNKLLTFSDRKKKNNF